MAQHSSVGGNIPWVYSGDGTWKKKTEMAQKGTPDKYRIIPLRMVKICENIKMTIFKQEWIQFIGSYWIILDLTNAHLDLCNRRWSVVGRSLVAHGRTRWAQVLAYPLPLRLGAKVRNRCRICGICVESDESWMKSEWNPNEIRMKSEISFDNSWQSKLNCIFQAEWENMENLRGGGYRCPRSRKTVGIVHLTGSSAGEGGGSGWNPSDPSIYMVQPCSMLNPPFWGFKILQTRLNWVAAIYLSIYLSIDV